MKKTNMRFSVSLILFMLTIWVGSHIPYTFGNTSQNQIVYWIPIEENIEQGLSQYLKRAFAEAEESQADAIILEIDTLGGEVNAALDIGKTISSSSIPVTAYIKKEAISAGAYISLNAKKILMAPGSTLGAAEPRTISGATADPKMVAMWASNMRSVAEANGYNPDIAAGMVDRNLVIDEVKSKGELVSLSAEQAVTYKFADKIVADRTEVLSQLQLQNAEVIEVSLTPSEKFARFITSPYVIPVLFLIGLAGIAVELFTPGFGLPGAVGLSSFGLYFFGHYIAGFAGPEILILFVVGVFLMGIEIIVPGFGIFGLLGFGSLVAGIAFAAFDPFFGLTSFIIALMLTAVGIIIAIKYFGVKGTWNMFILRSEQKNESGYNSSNGKHTLIGKKGVTTTPLRPSGWALIEGERFDVMSEGAFIDQDTPIQVVRVSGASVFVRSQKSS
ncbi:nodulation protein NfeD [Hazenella sp. IB182353]|uniref:NfeD family protein n=1 Tax=Polycladospora coralii TaxID=2771432 RepID=UPI001746463A|nr:nodulation protein NfeD [Polycladospora coralii]MBS7531111.1 nodulation protein NfeD [Polycladospora coralii]